MDWVGETYRLWRDDQDIANYSHLISILLSNNCSAFIGAGLSVHAGYPSSKGLIDYLIQEVNINLGELNDLDDFSVKVTKIKDIVEGRGENFYEVLYRRFNINHFPKIKKTTSLLENFINIPFRSIVTTNYDNCIEEVANFQNRGFSEVQIYPYLDASNLEKRKIYYVHGKIDHTDLDTSSNSLVLTTESYVRAYGDSPLPVLLDSIFDAHNIVFIGFALEETTLFNLLESAKKRKDFIRNFPGKPPKNPPFRFAILPIERSKIDPNLPKNDVDDYLTKVSEQDKKAASYGVLVSRYYANSNFSETESIISNIRNVCDKTKDKVVEVDPDLTETGVPT